MTAKHLPLGIASLALAAGLALGCGSGSGNSRGGHSPYYSQSLGYLESMSVSPTSADANDYPNGQVPFVATGYFSQNPTTPVSPLTSNWAAVSEQTYNGVVVLGPTTDVSVSTNGVAQCSANASGTYEVIAWNIQDPSLQVGCASETFFGEPGCNAVQATAQLTCP